MSVCWTTEAVVRSVSTLPDTDSASESGIIKGLFQFVLVFPISTTLNYSSINVF